MDYTYEALLERAWKSLPEKLKSPTRFEIPKVDTLIEGNQTIIKNFNEITNTLGREGKYIIKYLSKDLAAPVVTEGNRVIIQRRISNKIVNEKVGGYAKEYVICHECGRPDTKITSLEGHKIIKCEACGGWWPLKRIK